MIAKVAKVAALFIAAGAASVLWGQDDTYLRDPSNLKKEILNSSIYRARDTFYAPLSPTPIDLSHQALTHDNAQAVENLTTGLFNRLLIQYSRRRSALELYFGPLPEHLDLKLQVDNSIRGARVVPVGATGDAAVLRYSYLLVQADYRAAVMSASHNLVTTAREISEQSADATAPNDVPEQEALAALDAIRNDARTRDIPKDSFAGVGISNILNARNVLSGNWEHLFDRMGSRFILIDEATAIRQMSDQYYGALMFALAHEMGHMVLRTMNPPADSDDSWKRKAELDADRFATFFLAESFMSLGVRKLPLSTQFNLVTGRTRESAAGIYDLDAEYAESALGYGLFFGQGYDNIYGADQPPSPYPDPASRRLAAEEVYTYVYAWFGKSILEDAEKRDVKKRTLLNLFGSAADSMLGVPVQ